MNLATSLTQPLNIHKKKRKKKKKKRKKKKKAFSKISVDPSFCLQVNHV